MLNKRAEKGQKGKNGFFYLILILMLGLSFKYYREQKNASVEAGNFGNGKYTNNVSFSDLAKKMDLRSERWIILSEKMVWLMIA